MKDEEYLFRQDVREKASTARSARGKRTHCGKSGRVKLPSDYKTKKEILSMNGECKSYRLNEPMQWKEFKAMPDDIKVTYIKALREKYHVPDSRLAEMFGVSGWSVSKEMKRLGISVGQGMHSTKALDNDGWLRWVNGAPAEETVEEPVDTVEEEETLIIHLDDLTFEEPVYTGTVHIDKMPEAVHPYPKKAIPSCGSMTFEGDTEEILNTIRDLLGGQKIHVCIQWDVL